jgi:hypothetical protein
MLLKKMKSTKHGTDWSRKAFKIRDGGCTMLVKTWGDLIPNTASLQSDKKQWYFIRSLSVVFEVHSYYHQVYEYKSETLEAGGQASGLSPRLSPPK